MHLKLRLLTLLFIMGSAYQTLSQPLIESIVRGSDGGGVYVEVTAVNCSPTAFQLDCPDAGLSNRYFWWKNQDYQPAWDNQSKVYIADTSADYTVYVYPNESLNPNNLLSYAISYAIGSPFTYNAKPRITGCGNRENQNPDPFREMQAYVVTSGPSFNWYLKVSGQWQSQSGSVCSFLRVEDGRCKEFKVEAFNDSNATSSKSYAIFWCMVGSSCSSCTGNYTIYNQ